MSEKCNISVFIPMNRSWRGKQDSKEWWEKRLDIFKKYTLESLYNQKRKPDFIYLVYDKNVVVDYVKGFYDLINEKFGESKAMVYFTDAIEIMSRKEEPPISMLKDIVKLEKNTWLFRIDNDDMVKNTLFEDIELIDFEPGITLICKVGYAYDVKNGKVYIYDPRCAYPPYYARSYPGGVISNDAEFVIHELEDLFNYRTYHYELGLCKKKKFLRDGNYCVTIHEINTITMLSDERIIKKISSEIIDPVKKKMILGAFGCQI